MDLSGKSKIVYKQKNRFEDLPDPKIKTLNKYLIIEVISKMRLYAILRNDHANKENGVGNRINLKDSFIR